MNDSALPAPGVHGNTAAAGEGTGDHRVRAAEAKRLRMRERLIDATMAAYALCEPGGHPVVDDVVRIAEVSRGSFYKHFQTMDEVAAEIGQRMAHEMLTTYTLLAAPLHDPAARVALGPLMALMRSAMEPRHGALVSRVDFIAFLAGSDPRVGVVAASLEQARAAGIARFASMDAAVDLMIGLCLEGARRIVRTRSLDAAYIREISTMVLRGLGVSPAAAEQALERAWQRLLEFSDQLPWWRPLGPH